MNPSVNLKKQAKRKSMKKSLLDKKKTVDTMGRLQTYRYLQRYFPSSGAFSFTGGISASYTASNGTFAPSTSADTFYTCFFRLGDLPQVSSFTVLYDQYRIDRVRFNIISQNNTSGSAVSFLAPHYITPDFDDNTLLTSVNAILEYQSCHVVKPYKDFAEELVPRLGVLSGTGSVNLSPQWLDCNDTTVQHYGVKGAIPELSIGQKFTILVEIEFSLKTVR